MDEECRQLLIEVARKDWEQELIDYRRGLVEKLAGNSVRDSLNQIREAGLGPGAWYGLGLGAMAGLGMQLESLLISIALFLLVTISFSVWVGGLGLLLALILMVATPGLIAGVAFFISTGYQWVGSGILGAVGFFSGGLVYGVIREQYLTTKENEMIGSAREQYQNYILSPEDLLKFWNEKLKLFLLTRQNAITHKIRECRRLIEECKAVSKDLESSPEPNTGETIAKLAQRQKITEGILVDAMAVNVILTKIEKTFLAKIRDLEALIAKRNLMQREQEKQKQLSIRIANLLGKTETNAIDWMQSKQQFQIELAGMIHSFEQELLHTKDMIEAEIEIHN
jgi:hypothetical protein